MKLLELPSKIETVCQAQAFLNLLFVNDLMYHCEDDATDCLKGLVSQAAANQINKLISDIYDLPGNDSPQNMAFDPCSYCLKLEGHE